MPNFTSGYTVGFAAAVCVVCSVAVASAANALKGQIETNELRDRQGAILSALGLPDDGSKLSGPAVDSLYAERVQVIVVDGQGAVVEGKTFEDAIAEGDLAASEGRAPELLPVYLRRDGQDTAAYAIPLAGKGLWGPLSGFLALEPDGATVSGTTFFAPKETPGLGFEITAPKFTEQWKGKTILDGSKTAPIQVVKGAAADLCSGRVEHCVDGVSGATITSRGVDAMVKDALDLYDPYLTRVRATSGG